MLVDDNREEHRMMIFGNDSQFVQERLIVGDNAERDGILAQKVHAESYTVTLYVLLKDYGLTPVFRIKPRIRFHRSNYDNLSSSAPILYSVDDIIHFAELKRGIDLTEKIDDTQLAEVLGDAPTLTDMANDAALQLVAQRDVSLRNPPFKTKTKVFGKGDSEGEEESGIPLGKFLDALNHPKDTERIFQNFSRGAEFARDLREALAPFEAFEFQFGLYSRYERRDCILAIAPPEMSGGYRATFDPWTALGYIRTTGDTQQFQILAHERGTRWEHKIMLEGLDAPTLERLAQEIRALRREYLIGRVLSKSQTALNILAHLRESQLNLTTDLPTGYQLRLEVPLAKKRFSVIEHRRKLRGIFNGTGNRYRLHPLNGDFVEKHQNLAKGVRDGAVWMLENVHLFTGLPPAQTNDEEFLVIRTPRQHKFVVRSAAELRERLPQNGFEKCWNETIDEGGYTILNSTSGRGYTVSYGRRETGSIHEGVMTQEGRAHYLSIDYLGVVPASVGAVPPSIPEVPQQTGLFARLMNRLSPSDEPPVPPHFRQIIETEQQILAEMKLLARYCKEKLAIP